MSSLSHLYFFYYLPYLNYIYWKPIDWVSNEKCTIKYIFLESTLNLMWIAIFDICHQLANRSPVTNIEYINCFNCKTSSLWWRTLPIQPCAVKPGLQSCRLPPPLPDWSLHWRTWSQHQRHHKRSLKWRSRSSGQSQTSGRSRSVTDICKKEP